MGYWIRKVVPDGNETPLIRWESESNDSHACSFPTKEELEGAGPRSVWSCECGRRWRLTAPFWRPLDPRPEEPVQDSPTLPAWVRGLGQLDTGPRDEEQDPPT